MQMEPHLSAASVILTLSRVAWPLLERTLNSVITHSPPVHLKEVLILVLGASVDDSETLNRVIFGTWPNGVVRVITSNGVLDVNEARMTAVKQAKGDVFIFMQSHCEVGVGWLEPLLVAVHNDITAVAVPVMDMVNTETGVYQRGDASRIASISWNFTITWKNLTYEQKTRRTIFEEPILTPVMPGEVFAVSRTFLLSVGGLKPGMHVRELELEFSFRTWMCGGALQIQPCSRVALLQPSEMSKKTVPVEDEKKIMEQLADVWMQEYRRLFYMYRVGILTTNHEGQPIDERVIAEREKCRSFKWYLDNLLPDRFIPDENVYSWGVVRNPDSGLCVSVAKTFKDGRPPSVEGSIYKVKCDHSGNLHQTFSYTFDKHIRQEYRCMDSEGVVGQPLTMVDCDLHRVSSLWEYSKESCMIKHVKSGLCLSSLGRGYKNHPLALMPCANNDTEQVWTFMYYLDAPFT